MRKLDNDQLNRKSIAQFKASAKTPITVVLDNVRSLNNIGSVFRTADAFLIKKIMLCGITAQPPNKEIHKTALGATETVYWEHIENVTEAIRLLQSKGIKVFAVEQVETSTMLNNFQPENNQEYAVVFGNEVFGVSPVAIKICDGCIEIPQLGTKHSLNVAVSAGIVLWDIFQKMQEQHN